ncbi:MAG TPA: S24/S26 family peptidase [Polyangia bacterium]|jgi:hypothetical protein
MLRRPVDIAVSGGSMRPLVPPGARVRVRPCALEEVRPGQIALFRHERTLIVHRVVAVRRRPRVAIAERGDASPTTTWRDAAALVGLVEGVWLGRRYLALGRGAGRLLSAAFDARWRWRRVPYRARRVEYALVEALLALWAGASR